MPGAGFHGRTHDTGLDGSIPLYGCPFSLTGIGFITGTPWPTGWPSKAADTVTWGCR